MSRFDLDMLRALAEEGIARHGLRGYARQLGLDLGTVRSLRDGRDIQVSKLMRILDAMQIGLRMTAPRTASGAAGFAEGRKDTEKSPEALRMGFLPLPFHPASGDYAGHAPVALSRDWLDARGLDAETLSFVTMPDDHLAPLLPEGALCLVDTSERHVDAQALWAHVENGRARIDLISQPKPGSIVIAGGAPHLSPRVCSGPDLDGLRLLGRVVWYGAALTHAPGKG